MATNPVLRWLWLVGATLGVLATSIGIGTIGPALPLLIRDLHMADLSELRWIAGAFALALAVLIVPAAVLGNLLGHARVLLAGAVVLALSSIAGAVATTGGGVLLARLAQGAGAALVVPQLVGYARTRLSGLERAIACGLFALAFLAGWVLGPVLGTQLAGHVTWRATFWVMVPLALLAGGAALPLVFERYLGRFDPPLLIVGLAAVPAVFGVMLPLTANGGEWSIWYVRPLLVGCVLLAGCVGVEVFRRGVRAGLGAPLLTLLAFAGAANLAALELYIQIATGESPSTTSLSGLPLAAGALIGAGIAVPVGLWLGIRAATASGVAVMFVAAAAQLALIKGAPGSFGWGAVAFGAALNGIGLGLVLTALTRTDGSGGREPADPPPAMLFAMLPLGIAAGVKLAQHLMLDVSDLVVGDRAPQIVDKLRVGISSTLIATLAVLVTAAAIAVFLTPRSEA